MQSRRSLLVAVCVCLVFAQACRQRLESSPDLKLEHDISPQPARAGPVTITLKLTETSGTPATGARVRLEANMSHAGMTPVFAEAKEIEAGRYRTTMDLSMAGDWVVLVHVNDEERATDFHGLTQMSFQIRVDP